MNKAVGALALGIVIVLLGAWLIQTGSFHIESSVEGPTGLVTGLEIVSTSIIAIGLGIFFIFLIGTIFTDSAFH